MKKQLNILSQPLETEIKTTLGYWRSIAIVISGFILFLLFQMEWLGDSFGHLALGALLVLMGYYLTTFLLLPRFNRQIKDHTIGALVLQQDSLMLRIAEKEHLITKDDETQLSFHYEGYDGEVEGYFSGGQRGYAGTSNYLTMSTLPSQKLYLYVANKKDRSTFNEIVIWCLEHHIPVTEFFRGQRVYGGKKLGYTDIQAFKKKYDLP